MKNGQLIATFTHNNKKFEIIYDDYKLRCDCYDEKGQRQFKFSKEEISVIVEVVKSLKINENKSSYVRNECVNGKIYKIYYDSQSRNYFWKSDDDIDIAGDNVFLNGKYNNIPMAVSFWNRPRTYEQELDKKLKKYYVKWVIDDLDDIYDYNERIHQKEIYIKYGKKGFYKNIIIKSALNLALLATIPVMLHIGATSMEAIYGEDWIDSFHIFSIAETHPTEIIIPSYSEDVTEYVVEIPEPTEVIEEKDEYNWELIRATIEKNPNLTDEEKNFIYELQFIFDEYHQYMDLDMVVSRLETLKIVYESGSCPDDISIGGYYWSGETNSIEFFNANSFSEIDISIFLHEFFHVLQCPANGQLTKELSNELFTREAIRRLHISGALDKLGIPVILTSTGEYEYGEGYEAWMKIFYDLVEVIPQDALCKFQFQCDERILVNGLCTNFDSLAEDSRIAWALLDAINASKEAYIPFLGYFPDELIDNINNYLNHFHKQKGIGIEQNANCMANGLYFTTTFDNSSFLLEHLNKSNYLEYSDCLMFYAGVQMRTYFSDTFPETIIYLKFTGRGKNQENGTKILKANGDYNKSYTIIVDETVAQQYSDYVLKSSNEISK